MNPIKPKLCLMTTGGTIGMVRDAEGIARLPANPADLLLNAPELARRYEVDVVPLMNKDSCNVTPADWISMAHAIHERWDAGYAGFVVAHGTDTMHYSASAVALALGPPPLDRPVVFTGAMRTADHPRPDGPENLLDACRVATQDFGEVLLVFNGRVLRGCRAMKRKGEDELDGFHTPGLAPLGEKKKLDGDFLVTAPSTVGRANPLAGRPRLCAAFASRVLPIALSPGVEPCFAQYLLKTGTITGVVLQGYGSGTVPNESPGAWDKGGVGETDMGSWVDFIGESTACGVPVLLTNPLEGANTTGSIYGPAQAAVEAGAIVAENLTAACAVVKFRWAIAKANRCGGAGVPGVRKLMGCDVVGEMSGWV